ncbi:FtsW/RodA/SpoVE family cell cycle protein [Pullulanibacillus sp. KACC 23026]|uniref:FtsW/RodA/SpoVE family cell cycle protein n=1 Tax=Pullulanibacillus sp. KACC 23026 TaxID=3028315 RepID=UPI0023B1CF08|nr:FtsW/RodA/SpoVE family cell cycle protein [Pullulanibacillus sp. KACC 23026]WEG11710.1 FtsW/RodA/SpoVE family cell cycle protein [Pullulanibacillus sp. KACC 23026]
MGSKIKELFRYYDYSLIVVTLLLLAFGLVMVYSASSIWSVMVLHGSSVSILKKQLIWCVLALIAGTFGMIVPYKLFKAFTKWITILTLALLVLVMLIGKSSNGATSWFSIGGFNIQPAEIAKLSVIIYLASVFSNKQAFISDFKSGVLPPLVTVAIFFILIEQQPDLGSAMIVAGISAVLVICSGMRLKHIVFLFGLGGGTIAFLFHFMLKGYQLKRFAAAYHPFTIANAEGWQLINSYVAIASGGLTGKGLGNSIEKAGFLPEPHTDFIIAIIAEELGTFGVTFVMLCLAYIVIRGILVGIRCQDVFGSLLAIGIASFVGVQTIVNLGAATGLLPVTGVTLPLVSYGGSSLIMTLFMIGILINVSAFTNKKLKQAEQEAA